jgi:hypothetical protein
VFASRGGVFVSRGGVFMSRGCVFAFRGRMFVDSVFFRDMVQKLELKPILCIGWKRTSETRMFSTHVVFEISSRKHLLTDGVFSSSMAVLKVGRQIPSKFALGALLVAFAYMLENGSFLNGFIAK